MRGKKGAVELSISTIVIIVLAMTMLIAGLVLIKNIFTGATYNVNQMNEKVKGEIGKLFVEDQKILVYLPDHLASASRNDQFGVAFGWVNTNKGTTEIPSFNYAVSVDATSLRTSCPGVSTTEAEAWIVQGKSIDPSPLASGDKDYGLIRFSIPSEAPLCIIRYNIQINQKSVGQQLTPYARDFFDLQIS